MSVPAAAEAGSRTVLYFHPDAREWAQRWHGRFELCERQEPPPAPDGPILWAAADHLELRIGVSRGEGAWVTVAEIRRRARQAPELLRACRLKPGMRVLDAMAGWGLDALVLATAGAEVLMVEREPLMQALQEDLVRRTAMAGMAGMGSVESELGDGFLRIDREPSFDVIYLDPMFPVRGKAALPGKRMQYLAVLEAVTADDRPLAEWVKRSIARARHRVVVKRRLHDDAAFAPDWQIVGRSIRYDVYRGTGISG